MSDTRSPALLINFPDETSAATRDRLSALLADYDLTAIHENDVSAPRAWTAHFADRAARERAARAIATASEMPKLEISFIDVEDDDWARRTQADLPAIRVGRIIVAPPWDVPSAQGGTGRDSTVVVEIEPSRGFGTGHHQSTRLGLVLLQNKDLGGRHVIDVGTGSGVLAIVAAKLGARSVWAIDVDPDAVENARENIERNGVGDIVQVRESDLTDAALAPADVVTANLTGALLARHASRLGPIVRRGGSLIVAGLTIDERQLVIDAFSEEFAVSESAQEDDWWAFVLSRP